MADFLDQAMPYAIAVLIILGAVALIVLIVVLLRAAKTMESVNNIVSEADKEVTPALKKVDPLVERVELTVDTVNLELLRVDTILEDVEKITGVAGKTASTVENVTSAPADMVTSLVERVRGSLSGKRKSDAKSGRVLYPVSDPAAAMAKQEQANKENPSVADELVQAAQDVAESITGDGEETSAGSDASKD